MDVLPRSVKNLIEAFSRLPGIGPKTASRLAFYLLHVPQHELDRFGNAVASLKKDTVYCSRCYNVGEHDPCMICSDPGRDEEMIMVIEQPIEIINIERTGKYKGVYHVLHGAIDPLNNIGPDEIRIAELVKRISKGNIKEVILSTNPTMEGEATAMYIKREIENIRFENSVSGLSVTRLANGLPIGADLEYADEVTLGRALEGRVKY